MKKHLKLITALSIVVILVSCGKSPEKTKTMKLTTLGLEMDVPESWSVTKESETSTEISRGGKGDKRLFYIEPAEGIDGSAITFDILNASIKKKDGFKLVENVKLKNGMGIKYEDKPGKNVNKNYWFIIVAKGKTYSVENGIYNDEGEYYELEKSAIESIR